jgi:large repetitive protein
MTASVADAKTWSISVGALPTGVTINPSSGVISGTPTTAGTFAFTVLAVIDGNRSDTKALSITVRSPLTIAPPAVFDKASGIARTEVGVRFTSSLVATGGLGPYTWTLTGTLPDGIEFDDASGLLSGRPELPGTYRFGLSVADTEGRTVSYAGRITVASRLAIVTTRLKPGKVGRLFKQKLKATGGVPALNGDFSTLTWRVKRGPLPRGIRFDRATGTFVGVPTKRGSWVVMVEIVDALRVKATAAVVIVVAAPPKPKTR